MDEYKIFTLIDDIEHITGMIEYLIRDQHSDSTQKYIPDLKKAVEELEIELTK